MKPPWTGDTRPPSVPSYLGPVWEGAELLVQGLQRPHVGIKGLRDGLSPLGALPCDTCWSLGAGGRQSPVCMRAISACVLRAHSLPKFLPCMHPRKMHHPPDGRYMMTPTQPNTSCGSRLAAGDMGAVELAVHLSCHG